MRVWNTLAEWMKRRGALGGSEVGFVPTMGALHRGHASLVERCRDENQLTVVSIFVNPTQFNDAEDLARYPRDIEQDLLLLERIGADEVLVPSASELYPSGPRFHVEEHLTTNLMEGPFRPGFFPGVMTVVLKLINLVGPRRAYFGEKDYQQLKVVSDMLNDFFIPTEIVACPTVRERSGLAESSRNMLLSAPAREKAAALYRALRDAPDPDRVRAALEADGFAVDYVEEHWGRRFAAVRLDGVRLIDNVPLES